MSDLIQAQLDEAQNTVEIDITDAEVTEDDVVFDDDGAEATGVHDDEEEKVWDEADCRIIINVRISRIDCLGKADDSLF